jgi:hypothetical protein
LRYLATFVESYDVDGFLSALKDRMVFHGTLRAETDGPAGRLVGQATSLAQFLVLEMWLDSEENGRQAAALNYARRATNRFGLED